MFEPREYDDSQNVFNLKDQNIRRKFATKVFGIVLAQIALTTAVILACFKFTFFAMLSESLRAIFAIGSIGTLLALFWSRSLARRVPVNYLLLTLFTVCQSFILFSSILFIEPAVLMMSLVYLLAIFSCLCIFSYNTSSDFTSPTFNFKFLFLQLGLSILLLFVRIEGIFMVIVFGLIFSTYIIIDLQLIFGKKNILHSTDDYVVAAITLYTDLIELFKIIAKYLDEDKKKKK